MRSCQRWSPAEPESETLVVYDHDNAPDGQETGRVGGFEAWVVEGATATVGGADGAVVEEATGIAVVVEVVVETVLVLDDVAVSFGGLAAVAPRSVA